MKSELYQRYRPRKLDEVIGQDVAVRTIRGFGTKIPHALMMSGPSGTGKTTLARIIADMLDCPAGPRNLDYQEVNCGEVDKPLDKVRDISEAMHGAAIGGPARVWLLDEAQTFSRSKGAQEGLLKILEDGPDHVWFMLCTTEPKRLLPTIRNRCTEITTRPVPAAVMAKLVRDVAGRERAAPPLDDRLVDKIVECAAGSPRRALVLLESVLGVADSAARLDAVQPPLAERAAFDLVKELIPFRGEPNWANVCRILDEVREAEQDPEGLRQMLLANARGALLKPDATPARRQIAYRVIRSLADPLYDRNSGHALLAAAAYIVVFGKAT